MALPLFLCILMVTTALTVNASVAFHDGFEYGTSLDENGWDIDNLQDPNMIAESDRDAASTGARGLLMTSNLSEGAVGIVTYIEVEYSTDLYFSYHIKTISGSTIVRLELIDSSNQRLFLDYGQSVASWETENIYDVGLSLEDGIWEIINRKLDTDIKTALQDVNSSYSSFEPVHVGSISIFQDNASNEVNLDEFIINPFGNKLFEGTTEIHTSDVSIGSFLFFPVILSSIFIIVVRKGIVK